jgi:type IV fimbrial biogenesis protein FimT
MQTGYNVHNQANHKQVSQNQGNLITPGMTVVELLIIVAALAVIILLAVPGSSMLLENYRLKSASSNLVEGLNLARGEALRRGSTVRVCPSSNGRFCRSDGDWAQGWLVYTDGNGDGAVQEIELIQAFAGPNVNVRITSRGAAATGAAFTVAGLVPANGSDDAEFVVCHAGSTRAARTILVDREGWVSLLASDAAGACGSS